MLPVPVSSSHKTYYISNRILAALTFYIKDDISRVNTVTVSVAFRLVSY